MDGIVWTVHNADGNCDENLTDEEDVIRYYNARKYKYLKMKVTSTALCYSVLVLFENKSERLEKMTIGVDIQSTWWGRGGIIARIKKGSRIDCSKSN